MCFVHCSFRTAAIPIFRVLAPLLVLSVLGSSDLPSQTRPPPCLGPEFRQFDFWVGDWEVRRPDDTLAGFNTIRRILGGCVLHERYTTPGGYQGQSLNLFDASRGVWHQSWVDSAGTLLLLEGGLEGDAMVLRGETRGPGGSALQRISWSLVEGDPDRVRQLWTTSVDGGKSWQTTFDGLYLRKSADGGAEGAFSPQSSGSGQ